MEVYDKERSNNFVKLVEENPVITKKGKKINLREYVNEGFEAADLATNLKKFGSIERIKKESAFVMLDNELLDSDFRDLLDLQDKAKVFYNQLSVEERRNLTEKQFVEDFKTFKEQKTQPKVEINNNDGVKENERNA